MLLPENDKDLCQWIATSFKDADEKINRLQQGRLIANLSVREGLTKGRLSGLLHPFKKSVVLVSHPEAEASNEKARQDVESRKEMELAAKEGEYRAQAYLSGPLGKNALSMEILEWKTQALAHAKPPKVGLVAQFLRDLKDFYEPAISVSASQDTQRALKKLPECFSVYDLDREKAMDKEELNNLLVDLSLHFILNGRGRPPYQEQDVISFDGLLKFLEGQLQETKDLKKRRYLSFFLDLKGGLKLFWYTRGKKVYLARGRALARHDLRLSKRGDRDNTNKRKAELEEISLRAEKDLLLRDMDFLALRETRHFFSTAHGSFVVNREKERIRQRRRVLRYREQVTTDPCLLEFRYIFDLFDDQRSGYIDTRDFHRLAGMWGLGMSEEELLHVSSTLRDKTKSEKIHFLDIYNWYKGNSRRVKRTAAYHWARTMRRLSFTFGVGITRDALNLIQLRHQRKRRHQLLCAWELDQGAMLALKKNGEPVAMGVPISESILENETMACADAVQFMEQTEVGRSLYKAAEHQIMRRYQPLNQKWLSSWKLCSVLEKEGYIIRELASYFGDDQTLDQGEEKYLFAYLNQVLGMKDLGLSTWKDQAIMASDQASGLAQSTLSHSVLEAKEKMISNRGHLVAFRWYWRVLCFPRYYQPGRAKLVLASAQRNRCRELERLRKEGGGESPCEIIRNAFLRAYAYAEEASMKDCDLYLNSRAGTREIRLLEEHVRNRCGVLLTPGDDGGLSAFEVSLGSIIFIIAIVTLLSLESVRSIIPKW